MTNTNEPSKELIEQELQKLGIKPNPKKEVQVTDANSVSPTVLEKAEVEEMEAKIKSLHKKATFSLKLDGDQINQLERLAAGTGRNWKEELQHQIESKIFHQKIGQAKISRPSNTTLITAPSNGLHHLK